MKRWGEADDPRRRLLIQALAAGFFGGGVANAPALAQVLGGTPSRLPAGRSIYRITGEATVDGKRATLETPVSPNSTLQTGKDSELIYAVGESAYIIRPNSYVVLEAPKPATPLLSGIKMLAGKLLGVWGTGRPVSILTKTATVGIRGTGAYVEADPEQTYFCTCYGVAEVGANDDPASRDVVAAKHHDRPLYIVAGDKGGKAIRDAPFINHTDQELMLIETLVGRQPPFVFPKSDYTGPRRQY